MGQTRPDPFTKSNPASSLFSTRKSRSEIPERGGFVKGNCVGREKNRRKDAQKKVGSASWARSRRAKAEDEWNVPQNVGKIQLDGGADALLTANPTRWIFSREHMLELQDPWISILSSWIQTPQICQPLLSYVILSLPVQRSSLVNSFLPFAGSSGQEIRPSFCVTLVGLHQIKAPKPRENSVHSSRSKLNANIFLRTTFVLRRCGSKELQTMAFKIMSSHLNV